MEENAPVLTVRKQQRIFLVLNMYVAVEVSIAALSIVILSGAQYYAPEFILIGMQCFAITAIYQEDSMDTATIPQHRRNYTRVTPQ